MRYAARKMRARGHRNKSRRLIELKGREESHPFIDGRFHGRSRQVMKRSSQKVQGDATPQANRLPAAYMQTWLDLFPAHLPYVGVAERISGQQGKLPKSVASYNVV